MAELRGTSEPIPRPRATRTPWEPHTTRRFTAVHISCEQVFLRARLGAEGGVEGRGPGRPVSGSLPIPRSGPPFSAHAIIMRSFPSVPAPQQRDDGRLARQMLPELFLQPLVCSPL